MKIQCFTSHTQRKANRHLLSACAVVLFVILSFTTYAQVLIPYQSSWKYAPESNTAPATNWRTSAFSDASWNTGNAPFGFGGHFYNTQLVRGPGNNPPNYPVFYFRKTITIADKNAYSAIRLRAYLDDGIAIFVNGVEVKRKNLHAHPDTLYTRSAGDSLVIDSLLSTSLFVNGSNLIAVEVHQTGETSSDVLFDLQLEGVTTTTDFFAYQSSWKYAPESNTAPATNWRTSAFSDASWNTGNAPFGFGGHFYNTQLVRGPGNNPPNYPVFYFRKTFTIANKDAYSAVRLRAYLDDGIAIFINGVEVKRKNLHAHPDTLYTRSAGDSLVIDSLLSTSLFANGSNLIAVEVHQTGETSSDILFDLQLEGVSASNGFVAYQSSWKYAPESNTAPASNWPTSGFSDAGWNTGSAPFGFGSHFYNTQLVRGPGNSPPNYPVFYFRKTFTIADINAFNSVKLSTYFDDGIKVFINGTEVASKNLHLHPDTLYTRSAGDSIRIDSLIAKTTFQNGTNIIAVEVHQTGETSSDILFDLELKGDTTTIVPATPAIYRYPYLQLASHNRMEIRWYTTVPTNATVRYSTNPNLTSGYTEVNVPNVDSLHSVTLKNLIADTKYYYSVGYNTGVNYQELQYNSAVNYFRTLPAPTDTTHALRFWLLGDSGGAEDFNQRPNKVRNAYLAYLNNQSNPHVDGVLFLGDNSNGQGFEGEQLALDSTFFWFYNRANDPQLQLLSHIPSWTVFGNHDYNPIENFMWNGNSYYIRKAYNRQNAASFSTFAFPDSAQIGGEPTYNKKGYYSFDQGDIHVVVLNPYLIEETNSDLDTLTPYNTIHEIWSKKSIALNLQSPNEQIDSLEQVKWLKRDLSTNTKKWTVVTFHIPPFSTIGHLESELDLMRVREKLMPILEKPEYHVDAVLVSHSHAYLRAGMVRKNGAQPRITDQTQFSNLGRYPTSPPYTKTNTETAYTYILSGNAGRGYYDYATNKTDGGYDSTKIVATGLKVFHPTTSSLPLDNLTNNSWTGFYHVKGGSMELLFRENRLDVKYIQESDVSPFFTVPDSFVVMKDVNKSTSYTSPTGTTTFPLRASWVGDYQWRNSPATTGTPLATTRTFSVTPPTTTTYYVRDGYGHLVDTFLIVVTLEVQSVKSGSWHDPTTWDCNCVPTKDQKVKVNATHTVTVSTADALLKDLIMNGGILQFQNGRKLCFGCTP